MELAELVKWLLIGASMLGALLIVRLHWPK